VRRWARAVALAVALPAASPALAGKRPLGAGERVDLNRAGLSELMRLPGVGEKRAQAILAHRERRPFRRPEDVLSVKGLGPAWFAKVKGHLSVGAPEPALPAGQPPRGPAR
jgi:competence protein ComEA